MWDSNTISTLEYLTTLFIRYTIYIPEDYNKTSLTVTTF